MVSRSLVFKVLGVIAGLVFLGVGVSERQNLGRVKRTGQEAVVAPIANYTEHRSRGMTTYTAEIRFKTVEGREVTKRSSFPAEALDDFRSGQPVKVLYDPRDPYEFVFEKQKPSWLLIGGGIAMALAALVLL
ncbi:DUF3592 domain-containing protein [Ramlibacter sp. USB13]|uniref:DUF3592 domain-containing protein n=1 Tax=Ramlibacter cellulosilyticus TaxID=2764187 RepID=A0A923SEB8_9BURK|nr:DUF3592 domain-containing protein [Ramlibacter cellulosilyticus]MBC5786148.1 DUF3592 domain-containing protein [Ramlibacter cellulosilyticus]